MMTTIVSAIKVRGVFDIVSYINDRPGIRGRAGIIWWLALGGLFLDAFSNSALSAGLGPMTRDMSLTTGEIAIITSIASWVSIVFNPIGGWMADRWGRRVPIIMAKVLAVIGAVLAAFAPTFGAIIVGRLFVGAAYGMDFAIAIALLGEMTPKKFSSRINRWQGIWYTAVSLNLVLAIGLYSMNVGDSIWRYALGASGIVALALFLLQWRYMVESPTWLARKGRLEDAVRSMTTMYHDSFIAAAVAEREVVRNLANRGVRNVALIFRGIYLPRTILATTIQLAQAIQYFAVGWYLPIISLSLFGDNFIKASAGSLFFNLFGIVGGFSSALIARRLGLRIPSAIGFTIVAAILVSLGLFFNSLPLWLAVTLPSVFILCHSAGPGANGKSVSTLSFRSEIRATANGFIGALGGIGAAIGLTVFPLLKAAYGLPTTFLILALVPAIAAVICFTIKWEPTKSLVPVDEELNAPNFKGSTEAVTSGVGR